MYKVRFHLGRGVHYKHWQITGKDGVEYYDPEAEQLTLRNCTLISQPKTARKVFESGKKDVCGWISCSAIVVEGPYDVDLDKYRRVWYNPIVDTEWYVQGYPNPATGLTFPELITKGNRVYCYDFC